MKLIQIQYNAWFGRTGLQQMGEDKSIASDLVEVIERGDKVLWSE